MKTSFFSKAFIIFPVISLNLLQPLNAQETKAAPPRTPDPMELRVDWWSSFTADEKNLEDSIKLLAQSLSKPPETLSKEGKDKADDIIKSIKLNLQNYLVLINQELPRKKAPTPYKSSYSVEDLLSVNTHLKKEEINLQAVSDELDKLSETRDLLLNRLIKLRTLYDDSGERSESRYLLGLEIINLRISQKISSQKIVLLKKTQEIDASIVQDLQKEVKTAAERLTVERVDASKYEKQIESRRQEWEELKKRRQTEEATFTRLFSNETTGEAESGNQFLSLELMRAKLQEMQGQNRLLGSELTFHLAKLIHSPETTDVENLNRLAASWANRLNGFTKLLQEYNHQANRYSERASRLLTLSQTPENAAVLKKIIELSSQNLLLIQNISGEVDENLFILKIINDKKAYLQGRIVRFFAIGAEVLISIFYWVQERLGEAVFYVGETPITFKGMFQFVLILTLTFWISRIIRRTLKKIGLAQKGIRHAVLYRLTRLVHYSILTIGLLMALSLLGFNFTNLILVAGALGVGLGFGLQAIFNNFISGLIILFQSNLKVGDYVELEEGLKGEIREINVRNTVITTNDGVDVLVPNSELISKRIINWTMREPYRRIRVAFSVAYGSDIGEVSRLVKESAKKVPCTLEKLGIPEPNVYVSKLGDNGIEMELIVWVDGKWARRFGYAQSMYLQAIEKTLRDANITIPFPQRDVHMVSNAEGGEGKP